MKTTIGLNDRQIDRLRMLADWQLRQMGYDPAEVTARCRELDERMQRPGA